MKSRQNSTYTYLPAYLPIVDDSFRILLPAVNVQLPLWMLPMSWSFYKMDLGLTLSTPWRARFPPFLYSQEPSGLSMNWLFNSLKLLTRPRRRSLFPKWDLTLLLEFLISELFDAAWKPSIFFLTLKTTFQVLPPAECWRCGIGGTQAIFDLFW